MKTYSVYGTNGTWHYAEKPGISHSDAVERAVNEHCIGPLREGGDVIVVQEREGEGHGKAVLVRLSKVPAPRWAAEVVR